MLYVEHVNINFAPGTESCSYVAKSAGGRGFPDLWKEGLVAKLRVAIWKA